jgi:hypothetical protein
LLGLYETERNEAYNQWSSALLKRAAARDKSLLPLLKQSAAGDKLISAELKKFYALAKMRLLALLRSNR